MKKTTRDLERMAVSQIKITLPHAVLKLSSTPSATSIVDAAPTPSTAITKRTFSHVMAAQQSHSIPRHCLLLLRLWLLWLILFDQAGESVLGEINGFPRMYVQPLWRMFPISGLHEKITKDHLHERSASMTGNKTSLLVDSHLEQHT